MCHWFVVCCEQIVGDIVHVGDENLAFTLFLFGCITMLNNWKHRHTQVQTNWDHCQITNWKSSRASPSQCSNQKSEKRNLGNLEAHLNPWRDWRGRDIWFKCRVFSNLTLKSKLYIEVENMIVNVLKNVIGKNLHDF